MADNKLKSLTEIFNQNFFRIPDFQRGYSWKVEQLNDFWDDLENLKPNKFHYTGLLTVELINKCDIANIEKWQDDIWLLDKGMSAYYIIDGQQRLTTAVILINEILELFSGDDGVNYDTKESWVNKFLYKEFQAKYKSFIFGYEKDNPSDEYFKTKILGQQSTCADKFPEQTLYTANLSNAKNYFKLKLKELDDSKLEELFKKVTNKLKFNFYEIDDELDVHVTFETMNNRGKKLSNLELLKNRLIYISTLINEEDEVKNRLRKDVNEVWKTIYEYLGKNKDNPLNDDVFLFNHWIMYFEYNRKESDAYARSLLSEKFTAKAAIKGNIKFNDIKIYIDSLSKCIKAWYYLFNVHDSDYCEDIKECMQKFERIGMGAFAPLLMGVLTKENDERQIIELLKASERFIFLVFQLTKRPSNTQNSHFYRLANLYYWETSNIEHITDNINYLIDGCDSEGNYKGWFDLYKFETYMQDLDKRDSGYYAWTGLKYFLYEYELSLMGKANGNHKITWTDFNKRVKENTIEHIYPQTPKDVCWRNAFKKNSPKQKKALLNSLGNLLLLGQSKNSELQNKCFDFKRKHINSSQDEIGYFNGSYSEIEVSAFSDWTEAEIKERGIKMLEFMEERWGFDISEWSHTDKMTLLNINF